MLGWRFYLRKLEVSFPDNKLQACSASWEEFIEKDHTNIKSLEAMIGQLDHVAHFIPLSCHFLNASSLWFVNQKHARQTFWFSQEEEDDLALWQVLFKPACQGLLMNLLTIWKPTRMAWLNSCPFRVGGHLLRSGFA